MSSNQGGGLRFNQGKARYDLIPAYAQHQYALVLTKGAEKYAERNWEKGMPWSKILSSLERHLYAIKRGEDYDPETGLLHSAHIMCNAAFLTEYYKIFPQGDDRPLDYLKPKRIGIDIDDVLADFLPAYARRYNIDIPTNWNFDDNFLEHYQDLEDHFFENLASVIHPAEFLFEPVVYVTSRRDDLYGATFNWLWRNNNYPVAPLVFAKDKLEACKEYKVDVFIDDKFETFVHLNNNGILCYLFDAPHNRKYNVGHKRITKETLSRVL
jgi:5'(3')-deoxyribonucleotidase